MTCKKCGSYAINSHLHGRDNSSLDLCDVCYWRQRAGGFADNGLVNPGDKLLIAITFPEDLDGTEGCHQDLVLGDFLACPTHPAWKLEIHSILRKENQ